MDKKIVSLVLNLVTFFLALAGLILTVLWVSNQSFNFEMNVLGVIFALTVIAAGLTYYYQVSKT